MMYHKILVPIDLEGLELVDCALDVAQALANAKDTSQLRLINVQPLVPVSLLGYLPPSFDEEFQKEAQKKLGEIAGKASFPRGSLSTIVRYGAVYPEVLAEAEDWGADLIIVGSHRPGMATYVLGTSAAAIVRHAKCSVLVVRQADPQG
jgi:nucleotide-binding universal stress UspA family protein